jgi:hypothetical protein
MTADVSLKRTDRTTATGVGVAGAVVVVVMALATFGTSEQWGALVVACLLVGISIPILRSAAVRHGERALLALFIAGLLLRIVGAVVRSYVDFEVYAGASDATYYHQSGVTLADKFGRGDFDTGYSSLTGTDFIRWLTGVIYVVIGPSRLAGFIFFAGLGFWGSYFFFRAFTIAFPEGRTRAYARLIFLLPSFLFWPSSIGKDAWMMCFLGLAAFGAARFLSGKPLRGLVVAAAGLWFAAIVRPHIAGILGIALATAVVVRVPAEKRGHLAPIARGITFMTVGLLAFLLVGRTQAFLTDLGVDTSGGVTSVLEQTSERASYGGSYIAPSIATSPRRVPMAVVTVLYRPLLIDAHNTQALATGLETTFLLALSFVRFRWMLGAVRHVRRRPYLALCAANTVLMIFILSNLANFGLLARQRIQFLPFFLVWLCVPAPARPGQEEAWSVAAADAGAPR